MEPLLERQHIEITPGICDGQPRIAGHRIRVQDIVGWTELGQTPDEIVDRFPQLSLADIHAALAYYFDHRDEMNRQLQEDEELIAQMKAKLTTRP